MLLPRVLTALGLVLLMFLTIFFAGSLGWTLFCGLTFILALSEFAKINKYSVMTSMLYLLCSLLVFGLIFYFNVPQQLLANPNACLIIGLVLLFYWIGVVPYLLFNKVKVQNPFLSAIMGWLMFLPFGVVLSLLYAENSLLQNFVILQVNLIILFMILLVWVADISAYFVGKAFGKHKLAPQISPGKSIEGALGAVIVGMLFASAYYAFMLYVLQQPFKIQSYVICVVIAIPLTCVSIIGDLFESWLKRCAGIKDSGKILPGHGGVYDRVDSLVAVLALYPLVYVIITRYSLF